MQTATGREVVLTMLDLATDIAHWNKKYTTKTIICTYICTVTIKVKK